MGFLFLATCTTPGTTSQIPSTIIILMKMAEGTRMVQRSMSVGPNTPCLIIGILPGPTKYFRDVEGSSGLTTGGEQFCNYFFCPSKTAYTGFYRYLPEKSDLICAGNGCAAGNDIARFSWGSADSTPLVAAGVVCSAEEGGSAGCKILDVIFPPK